jgi:hypothetical protein
MGKVFILFGLVTLVESLGYRICFGKVFKTGMLSIKYSK